LQVKNKEYVKAAEKAFEYITGYLEPERGTKKFPHYDLTLAYHGQLALTLGLYEEAHKNAVVVFNNLMQIPYEIITYCQIATFFAELGKFDNHFLAAAAKTAAFVQKDFEKKFNTESFLFRNTKAADRTSFIEFVKYAELLNTYTKLYYATQDSSHKVFLNKANDWFGGVYRFLLLDNSLYTRGVAKIFEILVLEPETHKIVIQRALSWIFFMQFTRNNTFFVPAHLRERIIGGFRHDYLNQECWIDSASHVLLGGSRLIQRNFLSRL